MAVNFSGKWKEVRSENKEGLLEAMGLPEEVRKKLALRSTMEIIHDGDNVQSKSIYDDGKVVMENSVKIGVPYTPKVPEGVPPMGEMLTTLEDGGKTLMTKPSKGGKGLSYRMYMEKGELVSVQKFGEATSTEYYSKV